MARVTLPALFRLDDKQEGMPCWVSKTEDSISRQYACCVCPSDKIVNISSILMAMSRDSNSGSYA